MNDIQYTTNLKQNLRYISAVIALTGYVDNETMLLRRASTNDCMRKPYDRESTSSDGTENYSEEELKIAVKEILIANWKLEQQLDKVRDEVKYVQRNVRRSLYHQMAQKAARTTHSAAHHYG
jgi:hypothetical protein